VIGNGGGGKSTLCRVLGERLGLPVYEVDAVQWLPGWRHAPFDETARILHGWASGEDWIIDGFGPFPVIERRLDRADTIVYVDFPFARHLWWSAKRQVAARVRGEAWAGQRHPPPNLLLFRTLRRVDRMRPQLLEMVSRGDRAAKLVQLPLAHRHATVARLRRGSAGPFVVASPRRLRPDP
jgi:adenylate kinase family enzyme